jgi:DNA-binding CsgD family transcriptional regulator
MSSVRNLAAAKAYVDPSDGSEPSTSEPARRIAAEPENAGGRPAFQEVWGEIVRGRLRPVSATADRRSVFLVAQTVSPPSNGLALENGLTPEDAALVVKVLCGEQRKVLASDMGIALSTATGRFLRALDKLELGCRNIPLPLVLAAQSWKGVHAIPGGRTAWVEHEGERSLALSVPRPTTEQLSALTPVEREVAQWLIEGFTRHEIADLRETSVHTVAGQFHSIYSTLRVSGRYELIRRAVELRCF